MKKPLTFVNGFFLAGVVRLERTTRGFGVDVGMWQKPPKTAVQSHFDLGSQVDRDALMLY